MRTEIINAIKNQQIIKLYYEGELRIVEPHCYGITTAGNEGLRAYQIGGYSSYESIGWKMFYLGRADDVVITEHNFIIRTGYKKGEKGMSVIFAEI
ncbi:WYL domain-containing protein [Sphingobacterium litopenaei]|uniref:WYL domain-containing protein n=1 Tax=Sphingobacterium litopenaei TaxID=2763500 RepID=A0ABR7YDR9_9SPHI|nr:hypothetical protein [Sphingobacterium litopenaei]MBD1429436.1 hypothetical protein [Sphingobacterium litopenaei]